MKPLTTLESNGSTTIAPALPDALSLATLAAQPRFSELDQKQSIAAALLLYREAQAALRPVEQPEKRPVTFEGFLKAYVPGKDQGEREQHFAEFIRWKVETSPRLYETDWTAAKARLMKGFRECKSPVSWEVTAREFARYWACRKTEAKRQAGRKGAAAKARSRK